MVPQQLLRGRELKPVFNVTGGNINQYIIADPSEIGTPRKQNARHWATARVVTPRDGAVARHGRGAYVHISTRPVSYTHLTLPTKA